LLLRQGDELVAGRHDAAVQSVRCLCAAGGGTVRPDRGQLAPSAISLEALLARSTLVVRAAEVASAALPIATAGAGFLGEPIPPYDKTVCSLAIREVLYAHPADGETAATRLVRVRPARFELFLRLHREYHLRRLSPRAPIDVLDPALATPPAAPEAIFFLRRADGDPDATHELAVPGGAVALRFRERIVTLASAPPRQRP
jgi:hypothetical protein